MRAAAIQMACGDDRAENLARAEDLVRRACREGATLVCLPELFLGKYPCQHPENGHGLLAPEQIPGPTTERLAAIARECDTVLIGGTIAERAASGHCFNTAPLFHPDGRCLGTYRKSHVPNDDRFHEQPYFRTGDNGLEVFRTPVCLLSVQICFDQWFPEAARVAALRGAEVIAYPSAIGRFVDESVEEGDWHSAWELIQRSHAIANNIFVVCANRVGIEDGLDFWGGSFIADSFGNLLAKAGAEEDVLVADCDLALARRTRKLWGFLQYRRPRLYRDLVEPR